jgi:FlaA1/EpsC-like NDP-sugar epimerase
MSPYDLFLDTHRIAKRLLRFHSLVVFTIEIATTVIAGVFAFLLRFDLYLPPDCRPLLLTALLVWIPVKLACFGMLDLHRGSWRYASVDDFVKLIAGNLVASSISAVILIGFANGIPRAVYFIQFLCGIDKRTKNNSQCLPSREHDRIAAQLRNTESAHCVIVSQWRDEEKGELGR